MRQKRFLSWIMVFALLVGMFTVPAYAEGNKTTITQENTSGTMNITLEIPKKTPAATDLTYTAPSDLAYSGSDKAATVAAKDSVTGMGTITVKYYSDASRTTEATPKNVGTYYVGATVAEGDQYAASTAVLYGDGWTFEITASTPDAPAVPTKASATKNSITLNEVSGCEYSKDGANWQSGTEFTGLLPGTEYTFYQRVKATANTNASVASNAKFSTEADTYAMTITLVIKPAQTITAENVTATYGDTDKSVSASVTEPTTGGGAITYTVKEGSGDYIDVAADGKLTIKKVPADGKAYVIVTAAGTDDYAETTKEVAVTISPAEVTVTAKDQSIYIGGTVPDLSSPVLGTHYTVTGLVGEDTLTTVPTLTYQKDGSAATPVNTEAGTYDIVPSGVSAGDNYTVSYANGTLTISDKGTQTITAEDVTVTYGDTDKKVSASVTDPTEGSGAISYDVKDGSGDYIGVDATTGALTIKKVPADGKAYVTVTAAGTATYEQATKDVTVTINKADPTVTAPTAKTLTYTGSAQELVNAASTNDGELRYAVTTENTAPTDEKLYTTSIPTKTDAGTYYVWYKAVGDENHNDSEAACVTATINPASVTLTANSGSETYDGTEKTVTGFTASVEGLTFTGVSATGSGTNAGEYDVIFSGVTVNTTKDTTGNYVVTGTTNGKLTVNPASVTLTANSGTETYDGTEKTVTGFTASVNGLTFADTVTASGKGTNAGEYDVTFSGVTLNTTKDSTGNYVVTGITNGKLTVNKANITPTVTLAGWYAGSTANTPSVTGNPGNGDVTYQYKVKDAADDTYSADVPTAIGSYTVKAAVAETDNYSGGEATADFTISSMPYYPDPEPSTPSTPTTPTETVTIPVSGEEESVDVTVEVKDDTATVTGADVEKVLEAEEVGTVTIDVSALKENVNEVVIPGAMVDKIADAVADEDSTADGMEVKLPTGTVSFDAEAVAAIAEQTDGKDLTLHLDDVKVTELTTAQQDATKELEVEVVLDAYMTSNGQRISDFNGGSATVKIPYTLKDGQTAQGLVVWYVATDGTRSQVPASYDGKNVVFTVPHFSNYVIAYDAEKAAACPKDDTCPMAAFTDLDPTLWYHDGIHFCLENGMMNGVGNGKFDPTGTTSRGMIVTILYRLENEPEITAENPFDDVEAGRWYTNAVIWAAENKIVDGYGGGKFGPNDDITREQLAVILYRYAQFKGIDVSVGEDTNILAFEDAGSWSDWSVSALQWAVGSGIINGKDGKLVPKGDASRAEAATMLQRFCENVK